MSENYCFLKSLRLFCLLKKKILNYFSVCNICSESEYGISRSLVRFFFGKRSRQAREIWLECFRTHPRFVTKCTRRQNKFCNKADWLAKCNAECRIGEIRSLHFFRWLEIIVVSAYSRPHALLYLARSSILQNSRMRMCFCASLCQIDRPHSGDRRARNSPLRGLQARKPPRESLSESYTRGFIYLAIFSRGRDTTTPQSFLQRRRWRSLNIFNTRMIARSTMMRFSWLSLHRASWSTRCLFDLYVVSIFCNNFFLNCKIMRCHFISFCCSLSHYVWSY